MKKHSLGWLGWAPLVWFTSFLLFPLILILILSFQSRGVYGTIEWTFQTDNFVRSFDPLYLKIILKSLFLAFSTTFACLIIGYPVAWTLSSLPTRKRQIGMFLLAVPFLTNLLIRIYALKVFTGYDGPLTLTLNLLGFSFDPFQLSQNWALVSYGMITTYLPFMVFPIYSSLEKMNFQLVEAAYDLSASDWTVFKKIIFPSSRQGALTGISLVFIPALGEFVIPDLLGGARTMLIGNLITEQFLKARDWPFGAALSMLMILILILVSGMEKLFRGQE